MTLAGSFIWPPHVITTQESITTTALHSNSRSQRLKRHWLLVTRRFSTNSLNARLRTLYANLRFTCVPHIKIQVSQRKSGRSSRHTVPQYPSVVPPFRPRFFLPSAT